MSAILSFLGSTSIWGILANFFYFLFNKYDGGNPLSESSILERAEKKSRKLFLGMILIAWGAIIEVLLFFPKEIALFSLEFVFAIIFGIIGIIRLKKIGMSMVPRHGHAPTWTLLLSWISILSAFHLMGEGIFSYDPWMIVPAYGILCGSILFFWKHYRPEMAV
ncbi:MAG: hypothetical protein HGB03_01390 [Candidatus Yonathbacteria bacterium]|nr:hypothetical protein [Candidatus Yonathbacteria bacterium]NTW47918.1 hypothetical protein [Candidatus Yonathbacteria bacterium]